MDQYYINALKVSYFNALISRIEAAEQESEENYKIDQKLLDIWSEKLERKIDQLVLEFSENLRPTYMMTDEEFKKTFQESAQELVEFTTKDLLQKNLIREKGKDGDDTIYELMEVYK